MDISGIGIGGTSCVWIVVGVCPFCSSARLISVIRWISSSSSDHHCEFSALDLRSWLRARSSAELRRSMGSPKWMCSLAKGRGRNLGLLRGSGMSWSNPVIIARWMLVRVQGELLFVQTLPPTFDPYRHDSRSASRLEQKPAQTPLETSQDHLARQVDVSLRKHMNPLSFFQLSNCGI